MRLCDLLGRHVGKVMTIHEERHSESPAADMIVPTAVSIAKGGAPDAPRSLASVRDIGQTATTASRLRHACWAYRSPPGP